MKYIYTFLLLSTLCVAGCGPVERIAEKDQLAKIQGYIPVEAVPLKYLGNHWYIFECQGELFLIYKYPYTSDSITVTHIATSNKELRAELESLPDTK